MVAYRMQGNYNVETENGELVNTLSKTLGESVEQDKDGKKYYYWSTDKSIVKALYDYERSDNESDTALLKALYLATFEVTKKWTMSIRNWGQIYGELSIMYEGRRPE